MGNKRQVYLAGPITSEPYTLQWRQEATTYLNDRGLGVLDPMRGKDPKSIVGLGFESNIPGWLFTARDYIDLESCQCVLANFLYIPERQCIGTLMELGYSVALNIPFIVVTDQEQFTKHPFIYSSAIKIVPTLEEALHALEFILMEA